MIKLYERGGFIIRVILTEMEFEKVSDKLGKLEANIVAIQEYLGKLEKKIITTKERGRGSINTLPQSCLPAQINIYLIYFVITWLNAIYTGNGISLK